LLLSCLLRVESKPLPSPVKSPQGELRGFVGGDRGGPHLSNQHDLRAICDVLVTAMRLPGCRMLAVDLRFAGN
jgi:hypothetical protein